MQFEWRNENNVAHVLCTRYVRVAATCVSDILSSLLLSCCCKHDYIVSLPLDYVISVHG